MDLFTFNELKGIFARRTFTHKAFAYKALTLRGLRAFTVSLSAVALLGLASCGEEQLSVADPKQDEHAFEHPIDFPAVIHPADNPSSPEKIELGRRLFYDQRMSILNTRSCGSCHKAGQAFAESVNISSDKRGAQGRQAMAVINVAYDDVLLWDGTFKTLEHQVEGPFKSRFEFNQEPEQAIVKLKQEPMYKGLFTKAFGDEEITFDRIRKSIAAFERTFISGHSAFDEFNRGKTTALNASQIRGMELFMDTNKTNCVSCHSDHNLSDGDFHSTGLEEHYSDGGLETITGDPTDNGKFKTPTLRNIFLTGPYMHDGRFRTLREVVQHYNDGGHQSKNKDPLMRKLNLTESQMQDVVAFLESLTDNKFVTRKDLQDPWR